MTFVKHDIYSPDDVGDMIDEYMEERLTWVESLADPEQKKQWREFYHVYYRSHEAHETMARIIGQKGYLGFKPGEQV